MDIAFVSGASAYSATDPVTVAAIAGLQDGDILLACDLTANNSTYTVTWPARFTEIAESGQASRHSRIAWKRFSTAAGDSAEDTYDFEVSDLGTARSASILVFRGCRATGNPFAHVSNTGYATSDTTVRAAGFTTDVEAALVWWGCVYSDASLSGAPSGFTPGASNPSSSYQVHSYYKLAQAAGATGDIDGTMSAAVTAKHAFMVDLIPAGAAGISIPLLNHLLLGD